MALRDFFSVLQRGHATVRLPIWYRSVAFLRLQKSTLKEFANWLLDTLQESLQSLCPNEYPLVYVFCAALWVGCAVCSDMCQSPNRVALAPHLFAQRLTQFRQTQKPAHRIH